MQKAFKSNQELTGTITNGTKDIFYGFGGEVANSVKDHEAFFNTWDTYWDIYKKPGYPKVNNLEDFEKLSKDMV